MTHDPVNNPVHYIGANGVEAIDVITNWQLGFPLGNACKYLIRAGRKGDADQDLAKADWYIRFAAGRVRAEGVLIGHRPDPALVMRVDDIQRAFKLQPGVPLVLGYLRDCVVMEPVWHASRLRKAQDALQVARRRLRAGVPA